MPMAAVVKAMLPATFVMFKLAVATLMAALLCELFNVSVDSGNEVNEKVLPIAAVVRLTLPPTF